MAPPDDKKSPVKATATTVETINLKLFIHCEGCKRKVKKILCDIEGVESVDIDADHGKVTVIGIVDSKVLLKKLEKKGKVAEVLNVSGGKGKVAEVLNASGGKGKVAEVLNASGGKGKVAEVLNESGGKGKEQQKDQSKGDQNKKPKKVRFEEAVGDKKSKGGGDDGANSNSEGGKKGNKNGDNKGVSGSNGTTHTGHDEKKKKGGDDGFDELGPSNNTAHKNVTPRMIETGSSVESADYATHIFSDENTDSCRIM